MGIDIGSAQRRVITNGIVLVTRQSTIRVAGLSVLQRTIFALERARVHSITLIARSAADRLLAAPLTRDPKTRVRWCAPEELPEAVEGDTLLLLCPVVLDSTAIGALGMLGDAVDPVIALHAVDQSGNFVATGAYLVAGAVAETTRCLLNAISAGNAHSTVSVYPCARLPAGVCYPLGSGSGAAEIKAAEKMFFEACKKTPMDFSLTGLTERFRPQ